MTTKPDFRDIGKDDAKKAEFPVEISGEYRVHLSDDAYDKMKRHADTTDEVELCGVLVGDVRRDSHGFFLVVTGAIEGKGANNYGAQVTFTHETWDHINAVKDREHPESRIVGWYHTHPGFGVFLSRMDSFIQENFFNQPYQVAIVVETKQDKMGCFAWVEGKSEPLRRLWVGDREVPLTTGEVDEFDPDLPPGGSGAGRAGPGTALVPPDNRPLINLPQPLVLVIILLLFIVGYLLGTGSARKQIVEGGVRALESEMYSILEFATLNLTAAEDLAYVRRKLDATGEIMEKGEAAQALAGVRELVDQVADLEKAYGKRRSAFRRDLNELPLVKHHLSERVAATARLQKKLEYRMAELMVMRAEDVLRASGVRRVEDLSVNDLARIKMYLDRAMKVSPTMKSVVESMAPGLLERLYPSSREEESGAGGT